MSGSNYKHALCNNTEELRLLIRFVSHLNVSTRVCRTHKNLKRGQGSPLTASCYVVGSKCQQMSWAVRRSDSSKDQKFDPIQLALA